MTHPTMPKLGALHMMRSGLMNANDHTEFVSRLATEYGDIVQFNLLGRNYILISNPEYVREVLVTKAKLFPKHRRDINILSKFIGHGLVTTNGSTHKKQRKLAQPAFHAQRIQNYAETIVDYTEQTIVDWQNGEVRDISQEMMELTMFVVCKTLFNVDRMTMADEARNVGASIHALQGITDKEFNSMLDLPSWFPTQRNRKQKQERSVLNRIVNDLIADRREETLRTGVADQGDLLSMLMLSEDEEGNRLGREELRDQVITLFTAGHETTSNALTWTWYLLSQHPEVEKKLHAELAQVLEGRRPNLHDLASLPYTEMVIKESMRMYPPVWALNTRVAVEDTTIGDYPIAKGGRIWISPHVMHHHPDYFPEPERFIPERFATDNESKLTRYAYIPFGAGPRICIGNSFAMMEAQLILATVAQKFTFHLASDSQVQRNPLITMSPKNGLRMQLIAREDKAQSVSAADSLNVSKLRLGTIRRASEPVVV